jgi:hypothetical protein
MGGRAKFSEGDWFAVPLRPGNYALGLLARRKARKPILLGYFFGPRLFELPTLEDTAGLHPQDAVLVCHFGHLALRGGNWLVIGRTASWDRDAWPMPAFVRYEELTGRTYRVIYDAEDPSRLLREELVHPSERARHPEDGLMGHVYVEEALDQLLA